MQRAALTTLIPLCALGPIALSGCFGLDSMPKQDAVDTASDTGGGTAGGLSVDRTALDFGTVSPGDDASEALVLTNQTDATLRVAASVVGDAVFALSDADVALAPGGDSVLTVTFSPSGDMTYGATLGLALEDGSALDVALSGVGGDGGGSDSGGGGGGSGLVTVSPSSKDLGRVDLGSVSSYTFTVENTGSDDAVIDAIRTTDAAFTITGGTLATPQVLTPGGSKTVEVTFAPTAERSYSASLVLHTDQTPAEVSAALTGTGTDACSICSPVIEVDTDGDPTAFISLFGLPDDHTWRISNAGDMDLTVSSVTVINDSLSTCGEFSVSGFTGPKVVAPSAVTTATISYVASSSCLDIPQGLIDANVVHIRSDDPAQRDLVIEVGGTGLTM